MNEDLPEDLVRTLIRDTWRVDDPTSALDLDAPRLRFELAVGETAFEALTVARIRADALLAALPGMLIVRLVDWDVGPSPPGLTWRTPVDDVNAEGAPRRIHTALVTGDRGELQKLQHRVLQGERQWDLWVLACEADDLLLWRPYDDRGADLVARREASLQPFREDFAAWVLPDVRCPLALSCDVPWRTMASTEDPDVRQCGRCARPVRHVRTQIEFHAMAQAGHCVAFDPELQRADPGPQFQPRDEVLLAGVPMLPEPPELPRKPWWKRWK